MLDIHNVTAGYGKETILQEISFSVEAGELTALLGLNGTGKTTLLKVICGLLQAKAGACFLAGQDIRALSEKQRARHISFMPQRHSIVYDTKVLEVVVMGITPYLGLFDSPTQKHCESAQAMLEKSGIQHLAEKNFLHLSEGQKQLVIFSRNLMQNAELMLFDEPDSALDFNNSHMVLAKIREIIKQENKAGVITLHDPNLALSYCDRIIILKDGKKFAEFNTAEADEAFLKSTFEQVYGPIEAIQHKDKFLIIKKD